MPLLKYITVFAFIALMHTSYRSPSEEEIIYSYIDTYKELAVVEMYRSGIPASIILAQGLHESNNGQSNLAVMANNHFGIKCKSYWTGKTYYHKDDDFDDQGLLQQSCFRSYDSPLQSYVDHSNFLMSTKHYSLLFQYDRTDYKNWAYGLKDCGYATDIRYSEKLIEKIEQFSLHQFDHWQSPYRSILGK